MENILTYLFVGVVIIGINYAYRYYESEKWKYANEPTFLDLFGSVLLWPMATIILVIDLSIRLKEYFNKKKSN